MPASTIERPRETTIRDQRTMVGTLTHRTPEDVQAAWETWAREKGLAERRRSADPSNALRTSLQTITAYVSDNCWTADCPNCGGGVPTWPGGNDHGCCLDCGTIYPVAYPEQDELAAVVEALEARPPRNRHYFPHQGETSETLRLENITHGYHPTERHDESIERITRDIVRRHGPEGVAFLRNFGIES